MTCLLPGVQEKKFGQAREEKRRLQLNLTGSIYMSPVSLLPCLYPVPRFLRHAAVAAQRC